MTEVIYHKNIYILLVDDVTLTAHKVVSFNIRPPLMKTLDRSVETLGRECNLCSVTLYTNFAILGRLTRSSLPNVAEFLIPPRPIFAISSQFVKSAFLKVAEFLILSRPIFANLSQFVTSAFLKVAEFLIPAKKAFAILSQFITRAFPK